MLHKEGGLHTVYCIILCIYCNVGYLAENFSIIEEERKMIGLSDLIKAIGTAHTVHTKNW
jgi:hypothetical protein